MNEFILGVGRQFDMVWSGLKQTNKHVSKVAITTDILIFGTVLLVYKLEKRVEKLEKSVSDLGKNGTDGDDSEEI